MGLSNEVLFILVAQGAVKQPEVKIGDTKKNLGVKPWPHSSGADRAERQNFFSDLQLCHLAVCSLLNYKVV